MKVTDEMIRSACKAYDDATDAMSDRASFVGMRAALSALSQTVAEAVASGEFSDWFDVWAASKGLTMMKTPDGRFMCPDTSLAEQAHFAGCMTTSIYYMELCRQEEQAKPLASSGLRGTGEGV